MTTLALSLIAIGGVWLLVLRLLHGRLTGFVSRLPSPANRAGGWLLIGLAWWLALALRGAVAAWCYYLDLPLAVPLGITAAVGAVGLLTCGRWLLKQRPWRSVATGPSPGLTRGEGLLVLLIGALLLSYLWRAGVPWYDHDEIAVYGLVTRQIHLGMSCTTLNRLWEKAPHHGPRLVQAVDAQLYSDAMDTLFVRLGRMANLAAMAIVILAALAALGGTWLSGLLGAAGVLTVPELAYLAGSLKPDAVVMGFELTALLLLVLAVVRRDDMAAQRWLLLLAGALAGASFGSRQSGLYLCLVTLLAAVWLLRREGARVLLPVLAAYLVIGLVYSVGYWRNLHDFGNPLYPFAMGWPFADGQATETVAEYRQRYNVLLPPVVREVYMLFHLGLGIEKLPVVGWLAALPSAAARGVSLGWLSPAILAVLIMPFYWRKLPGIAAMLLLFLPLYLLWCSGIHYSRVLLATAALPVLGAALIAGSRAEWHGWHRRLRTGLRALFAVGLPALLLLHVADASAYQHDADAFVSADARQAASRWHLRRHYVVVLPDEAEIRHVWERAGCHDDSVILALCPGGRAVSIVFPGGFFVDDPTAPADYLLVSRAWLLPREGADAILAAWPHLAATFGDGKWELRRPQEQP